MPREFLGFCQVCGKTQAIDIRYDNQIAKHGYQVTDGEFSGHCYGSFKLPFQLSCELVKQDIVYRKKRLIGLQSRLVSLQCGEFPLWKTDTYRSGGLKGYQYRKYLPLMGFVSDHDIETTRKNNIWEIESDIRNEQGAIYWQERRVKNWKLMPLILADVVAAAIAKKTEAEKAAKAKVRADKRAATEARRKSMNEHTPEKIEAALTQADKLLKVAGKVWVYTTNGQWGNWFDSIEGVKGYLDANKDTGKIHVQR